MTCVEPAVGKIASLTKLVSTIGDDDFGCALGELFRGICGAEHCTVLHLQPDASEEISTAGAYGPDIARRQIALYLQNQRWQRDPMVAQASKQLDAQPAAVVHTGVSEMPESDFRDILYGRTDICDRVMLCGRTTTGIIGLSLLRTSKAGAFSKEDVDHVQEVSPLLMSIVGKHVGLARQSADMSRPLTSLEDIEACLASPGVPFSRRERQVCARILFGMSSIGIALDLGIGEETVMTYRKRAYGRLGYATQRELILWYLALWNAFHQHRRRMA